MTSVLRDVLYTGGAPIAPGSPAATVAGSSNGTAQVTNTTGTTTSVARVQISIALGFLIAVAILVLLNRAGFKFSVTVGG